MLSLIFRICSKMKIYIIYFVPAQILYWEKSCSLNMGLNPLCRSDCRTFHQFVSTKQIDETTSFFAYSYKFSKIKRWLKIFWLCMVKNGCGQCVLWTLILTVFVPACKKISLFYFFLFDIQSILESHYQTGRTHLANFKKIVFLLSLASQKKKSLRWPLKLFFYLIQTKYYFLFQMK